MREIRCSGRIMETKASEILRLCERGAQKILYFCDGSEPFLWNAQSISSLLGGDRTERQQASVGMGIGGSRQLVGAAAGKDRG